MFSCYQSSQRIPASNVHNPLPSLNPPPQNKKPKNSFLLQIYKTFSENSLDVPAWEDPGFHFEFKCEILMPTREVGQISGI